MNMQNVKMELRVIAASIGGRAYVTIHCTNADDRLYIAIYPAGVCGTFWHAYADNVPELLALAHNYADRYAGPEREYESWFARVAP